MSDRPPTSVLLPTVRWTDAVDEVAAQLGAEDELLVICDLEDDPVARNADDLPDGARVVIAGEPEGCSGKANAIAAGTAATEHDRLVWTDDDFRHPPDWLATLQADYERQGPTAEVPFFEGRDPLATLLEPINGLFGTLGVYLGDTAWAGAVIFERDDLDADRAGRPPGDASAAPGRTDDEAAFLRDLRRTVSDDGLLTEYVDLTSASRVRRVAAGGSTRASLERNVRFTKISFRHEPTVMAVSSLASVPVAAACLLAPHPAALLTTALVGAAFAAVGVRRWTALLAYPATVLGPVLVAHALARRTFVWGGRRYRWRSKFDVEVVEEN